MKSLTIHCRDQPGDALVVDKGQSSMPTEHVRIQSVDLTDDSSSGPVILLDEDKARELFNWLGVWLLTHKPTP